MGDPGMRMSLCIVPAMTTPSRELRTSTVVRYAVGSIGTGGFATLPGLVLVYYLTDTLGVAALAAGLLVTLAKVWDVIIDPVIGARSDRSLARTGSRRRFMLLGGSLLPIAFVLTFAVPPSLGTVGAGFWVFLAFLFAATAFSLFQVPYIALPAELVSGYDARTRLLTARVMVLTFAILLFGAGGPMLRRLGGDDENLGYLIMAVVAGAVLGAGMIVSAFAAKRGPTFEAPRTPVMETYRLGVQSLKRSQPFRVLLLTFVLQALATGMMLAGAQYVATWVLGDEAAIDLLFVALIAPALVFTPVWAIISRHLGKERAFGAASVVFAIAALSLVLLVWIPGAWLYLPVAIAGAAYSGMQSLPMAMLPDVITHDARLHGKDRAGTFGGVWTAGETTGMALGATVLTLVLAATGYAASVGNEVVEQSPMALAGIVLSFSIVPAALVGASLWALVRYPLRRADIEADADALEAEQVAGFGVSGTPV
jgi:Na+/melibiose symporter-like transporter